MRPISKTTRTNDDGSPLTFTKWGDAKIELQKELGSYCSFCERVGYSSSLDVEHILAKGLPKYAHLIYRWDNFLLGCKNCNPTKGMKDFDINDTYMPHLNNLLCFIEVSDGGTLKIKAGLREDDHRRTMNFINLIGLDRDPAHTHYSNKDDRWTKRMEAWDKAVDFRSDYHNQKIRLERIMDMALLSGYWSVWMTVFNRYSEVKAELISRFGGTDATCFDNDFNAIRRDL